MKFKSFIPMLSLQLFAEGGAGDGGTAQGQGVTEAAALPQTKADKNPLASVKYGIQEDTYGIAKDPSKGGFTQDIAGMDMETALMALGELDGRSVSEEIVGDIFSRFCVGK